MRGARLGFIVAAAWFVASLGACAPLPPGALPAPAGSGEDRVLVGSFASIDAVAVLMVSMLVRSASAGKPSAVLTAAKAMVLTSLILASFWASVMPAVEPMDDSTIDCTKLVKGLTTVLPAVAL
jgi:hypothetical protein